eukprot:jgi/Botrbrau1/18198/Bobra.53_1s0059.2
MPGALSVSKISKSAVRRLLEEEQYQADTRKFIEELSDGDVLDRCRQLNAFLKKEFRGGDHVPSSDQSFESEIDTLISSIDFDQTHQWRNTSGSEKETLTEVPSSIATLKKYSDKDICNHGKIMLSSINRRCYVDERVSPSKQASLAGYRPVAVLPPNQECTIKRSKFNKEVAHGTMRGEGLKLPEQSSHEPYLLDERITMQVYLQEWRMYHHHQKQLIIITAWRDHTVRTQHVRHMSAKCIQRHYSAFRARKKQQMNTVFAKGGGGSPMSGFSSVSTSQPLPLERDQMANSEDPTYDDMQVCRGEHMETNKIQGRYIKPKVCIGGFNQGPALSVLSSIQVIIDEQEQKGSLMGQQRRRAATLIQSRWRGCRVRHMFKRMRDLRMLGCLEGKPPSSHFPCQGTRHVECLPSVAADRSGRHQRPGTAPHMSPWNTRVALKYKQNCSRRSRTDWIEIPSSSYGCHHVWDSATRRPRPTHTYLKEGYEAVDYKSHMPLEVEPFAALI